MRIPTLILLAGALCAGEAATSSSGPPAQGQDKRPSPEEIFTKADANDDGQVTLEELTAAVDARRVVERDAIFAKMDVNGDGQVSKSEFAVFEPPAPPGEDGTKKRRGSDPTEMMKRMDKNGDGVLTKDEMKRPPKPDGEKPPGDSSPHGEAPPLGDGPPIQK